MDRIGKAALVVAFVLALFASASRSSGQEERTGSPQIDVAAVLRLGDHVQHVDGIQAGPDDAFTQAMELPSDDSDKWFICVLTTNACPACDELRRIWNATPELVALGNPDDPARSWSHFAYWNMGDKSKAEKFRDVRTSGYPTIIVKPPKSGLYGPPHDIVYQHVGTMAGKDLARQIRESIKLRVSLYPGDPITEADSTRPASATHPVDVPTVEQRPISGTHRFPPLPFDPDGRESILPLFPGDEVPEVPPRSLIDGASQWAVGKMFSGFVGWLDGVTNGWGMELLLLVAAAIVARLFGYDINDAKALLSKAFNAAKKKPGATPSGTETQATVANPPACNPLTPDAERRIAEMVAEQLRKQD